jgi:hypothetical protein
MKSSQLDARTVAFGVLVVLLIVAWRWFLRRHATG